MVYFPVCWREGNIETGGGESKNEALVDPNRWEHWENQGISLACLDAVAKHDAGDAGHARLHQGPVFLLGRGSKKNASKAHQTLMMCINIK